ncbi:MAG: sugar phosphate nucleotidyltransferase [Gemmatimonadales bacterium]
MTQASTAAVVLAAGLGTRMRRDDPAAKLGTAQAEAAARGLKGMIPDNRGRPLLDHILSSLADGGVTDVCLVIGPKHDPITDHYALRPPRRVKLSFAVQESPRGTADALLAAAAWIGDRGVLVLNSDNLYPAAAVAALVNLGEPGLVAFERQALISASNIDAARIAAFGLVTLHNDDTLAAIAEKPAVDQRAVHRGDLPDHAASVEWISMNLWRFDRRVLAACRDVAMSPRGELELPLAVALALRRGVRFRAVRMAAGVLDLSSRGDILTVASRLGDREIQP